MQKWTYILLIWAGLLTQWNVYGQTSVTTKVLTLPSGQVRLKTLFASISNQTGCVFSYDARKINDKESVFIEKGNLFTLKTSLIAILPPDIKYKMIGKYIILYQKSSKVHVETKPLINKDELNTKESEPLQTDTILPITKASLSDSVNHNPKDTTLNVSETQTDLNQTQWSLEAMYNPHLTHLSLLLGKKAFYGKATVCYDYHGSYHMGLGVGMNINLTPRLGFSLDLSQYALAFGKTRKMDVNTYTTELNPLITYSLNKRIKVKVGPSVYRIQSNLKTKNETIDLGNHMGYNAAIGLQFLLFESN